MFVCLISGLAKYFIHFLQISVRETMDLTLYLIILVSCCVVIVVPRSLQADKDILQYLRIGIPKEVTTTESIDHAIWRILEQPSQLNINKNEELNSGDLDKPSNHMSSLQPDLENDVKDGENFTLENEKARDEMSLAKESQVNNKNKEVIMGLENDQNEKSDNQMAHEVLTERFSDAEMSVSEIDFDLNNTDVLSSILNITGDAILLQSLADNTSVIDPHASDETALLSDGGEVALFQEVSTVGFELMIDSETKKNLLLAQMINTEIITEYEDGSTLSTRFIVDEDSVLSTKGHENFNIKNSNGIETNETLSVDGENKLGLVNSENSTSNESSSVNEIGTDPVSVQAERPECPEPGWCVLFFLAQDTCAKDSHCLGSRICCKWRCSMTCIDLDNLDT